MKQLFLVVSVCVLTFADLFNQPLPPFYPPNARLQKSPISPAFDQKLTFPKQDHFDLFPNEDKTPPKQLQQSSDVKKDLDNEEDVIATDLAKKLTKYFTKAIDIDEKATANTQSKPQTPSAPADKSKWSEEQPSSKEEEPRYRHREEDSSSEQFSSEGKKIRKGHVFVEHHFHSRHHHGVPKIPQYNEGKDQKQSTNSLQSSSLQKSNTVK